MIVLLTALLIGIAATIILVFYLLRKKYQVYVCSYGGSGSWSLAKHLKNEFVNVSEVHHIHDRFPPMQLTYAIRSDNGDSHFGTVRVSDLSKIIVIFIYRNPVYAIPARFHIKKHLHNIESTAAPFGSNMYNNASQDPYKLEEFMKNYLWKQKNYPVYFLKFEKLFKHQSEIFNKLGLRPKLFHKLLKYRQKTLSNHSNLTTQHKALLRQIDTMHFLEKR